MKLCPFVTTARNDDRKKDKKRAQLIPNIIIEQKCQALYDDENGNERISNCTIRARCENSEDNTLNCFITM